MKWILESCLKDESYEDLKKYLKENNIDFELVKVIPYQDILVSPDFDTFKKEATESDNLIIENETKVFPFGSTRLEPSSIKRCWTPGYLNNENFTFEKWNKGFGKENILNGDAVILKFGDRNAIPFNEFFIRPCADDKAFAGKVMTKEEFIAWQTLTLSIRVYNPKLNSTTPLVIAPVKKIFKEARCIIVKDKYITGSYYKLNDKSYFKEIEDNDPLIQYVEEIIKKYSPALAYSLDIAETTDGFKIIEINNINSIGLYKSNISKFVNSINSL